MTSASIVGCRILVVEDETLIAILIEQALQELGCVIVGPVSKLDVALQLARDETMDAAILDVAIRGGYVYPVADLLLARGIPFVLASGYGDWASSRNTSRAAAPDQAIHPRRSRKTGTAPLWSARYTVDGTDYPYAHLPRHL